MSQSPFSLANLQLPQVLSPQKYQARRQKLVESLRADFPGAHGAIVLFGNLEHPATKFVQDSSFYYFTGITEPGVVLVMKLDNTTVTTTLFVPHTNQQRGVWVTQALEPSADLAQQLGVDQVKYLGEPIQGFEFYPFFKPAEVQDLLTELAEVVTSGGQLWGINPASSRGYFESRFLLARVCDFLRELVQVTPVHDLSSQIAQLRRRKDQWEIGQLYEAIQITMQAQRRAAEFMQAGRGENEIQGMIEFTFTEMGAGIAFPSIVGSGANSTILHYTENRGLLNTGDLVVVDIGASYGHYCADLTRTYPVSGKFTKRQQEIYELVLATQEYIAGVAKPGVWLNNRDYPEQSLNHLAHKFLQERGYGDYFPHGVGHYLGLDVHDVGAYSTPLQAGDVITIEPGIYLPLEQLGVRIEDNYWITEQGAVCLSEDLPKTVTEIEALMVSAGESELADAH